jgi:hypothetical protein
MLFKNLSFHSLPSVLHERPYFARNGKGTHILKSFHLQNLLTETSLLNAWNNNLPTFKYPISKNFTT